MPVADFTIYTQFKEGFAHKLLLKPEAVPSIQPPKEKIAVLQQKQRSKAADSVISCPASSGSTPSVRKAATKLGLARTLQSLSEDDNRCVVESVTELVVEDLEPVQEYLSDTCNPAECPGVATQFNYKPRVRARGIQVATPDLLLPKDQACQCSLVELPALELLQKPDECIPCPCSEPLPMDTTEEDEGDDDGEIVDDIHGDPIWAPDSDEEDCEDDQGIGLFENTGLLLAVLHYNENSGKKQATTKAGQARWAVRFRKANQGVATVSKIHESATYGYTEKLMARLFTGYSQDPAALSAYINDLRSKVPAPLSSKHQQVDKPVIVGEYETRFSDLTMQ